MKGALLRLPSAGLLPLRLSPLRLSLLAAVLLHLLGLSAWQLQRSRQRPPQRLAAADNTPLLLQFSREAVQPSELLAVPLPPAGPLPPPPPMAGSGGAPPALPTGPGSQRRNPPQRPQPAARHAGSPGLAGRTRGAQAQPAQAASPDPPSLASGAAARQALEKALREASAASQQPVTTAAAGSGSEEENGTASGAEASRGGDRRAGSGSGGSALAGSAAELRLWSLGRPVELPERERQGLPPGLELRELPVALARRSGARPEHLSHLRRGERLLLLWIDGPTLWLLSAPLPTGSGGGATAGPPGKG